MDSGKGIFTGMDFGRIKDASRVNFSLPPDHPSTFRILAKGGGGPISALRAHVGCPVWQDDSMARERVVKWSADVSEGFRFCPKLPMEITHGSNLDWVKEAFAGDA